MEKNNPKNIANSDKKITLPKPKKIEKSTGSDLIWLSVSEAAKVGGVQNKTIRRALKKDLKFKIKGNRYFVDLESLVIYLHKNTKLKNKLNEHGIGQYVKEWKIII